MFMADNVSYVQGPAQPLVIIHHPHVSTTSLVFFVRTLLASFGIIGQKERWTPVGSHGGERVKIYLILLSLL